MLGSFLFTGLLGALAFSWLDLELLRRMHEQEGDPLRWAVFLLAVLPFSLACWAVPLAVLFRLRYDRRVPAGLPSWRRGDRVGLQAHYRSVFWRGYASLFAWSLALLPVYLFVVHWWLVWLHLTLLFYAASRSALRQARLNREEEVVLDMARRSALVPPYGEIPWTELMVAVKEELTVLPKRDQICWWVTINGQNWKRCELREHAQAIADWLHEQVGQSP
jgi:hypothetical protein